MHQGNLLTLVQVIADPSVAFDLKQVAAIYLKNAIKRQWYSNILDASLKPTLTTQLLQLVFMVPALPPTVQDQLLECLRVAIQEHTAPVRVSYSSVGRHADVWSLRSSLAPQERPPPPFGWTVAALPSISSPI